MSGFVTVDGIKVPIEGEKNLLALIRKANIDIPTFCYHSSLSTYGACRLCLVEINEKDIDASCVVPPKDGMSVRTSTPRIRSMRRMNLELLLANHEQSCPTCAKSEACKLRDLASKMGIRKVRFRRTREEKPLDLGSPALVRDPNKCILCGDCVRYCAEIQGIGAIDFAHRGTDVVVTPAFGKSLGDVDCVNCGQCAAVCPTGAIVPKPHADAVWKLLDDPAAIVAAQIAPAVRVALGERFGLPPGKTAAGKIATALRMLGFDRVYDTAFGADITVVEEAHEILERIEKGERLPAFTSCCPAWVKYAEQFFPQLLPNLSSCMSPQSMMGSIIRKVEGGSSEAKGKKLRVVAIMPCTAKKFEIARPELVRDGEPLVDYALTTSELAAMIEEAGIRFADLSPSVFDPPLGFASGAGILFGSSGGVSEAVARYVGSGLSGVQASSLEFEDEIPGGGIRSATLDAGGRKLRITAVQGLANAKRVALEVLAGTRQADIVEVMACPGGCVGGAGQPVDIRSETRVLRAKGLSEVDGERELRSSRDNPCVDRFYSEILGGKPGDERAHKLLHTTYASRKRIQDSAIPLIRGGKVGKIPVKVCVGTSCFLRGSQTLLGEVLKAVEAEGFADFVEVSATFCTERCDKGPTVTVGDRIMTRTNAQDVMEEVRKCTSALEKGETAVEAS
jgi:NADH-quinone oxidoreductase subunit G